MKKYIVCDNYQLKGLGNQLRAIAGWWVLSKILNREFVINNTLVNYLFEHDFKNSGLEIHRHNTDFINIPHASKPGHAKWYDTDFTQNEQQILICGGGDPMVYDLSKHKILGKHVKQVLLDHDLSLDYNVATYEILLKILGKCRRNLTMSEFTGNVDNDNNYKFRCLQFRIFADIRRDIDSNIPTVDRAICSFANHYLKSDNHHDTYIISDAHEHICVYVKHKIKQILPECNIYVSPSPVNIIENTHSGHIVQPSLDFFDARSQWKEIEKDQHQMYKYIKHWLLVYYATEVVGTDTTFTQSACHLSNKMLHIL
jgi:hypothetical protein